jgi:hypothetical protein
MVRLALSLWLVVMLLAGCGGGGTLSKKALQKQLEAVQSFAAEGALVADGAADERTTNVFVRVHTKYLSDGTKKLSVQLASAETSPTLEDKLATARKLAVQVEEELDALHRSPGDRDVARRAKTRLESYAVDAKNAAQ